MSSIYHELVALRAWLARNLMKAPAAEHPYRRGYIDALDYVIGWMQEEGLDET